MGIIQVVENFLGSHRNDNYPKLVSDLLSAYHKMGCHISLKMYFIHKHGEHGERFHQEILLMALRYKGGSILVRWGCCWFL